MCGISSKLHYIIEYLTKILWGIIFTEKYEEIENKRARATYVTSKW